MKKFKVYSIGWSGDYGGGLCVVAANDPDEALKIAIDCGWKCDKTYVNLLPGVTYRGTEPRILDSDYYQE